MVRTPLSVILMLIKNVDGKDRLLLQRRQNTGFCDGLFDMSCSGHLEEGETFSAAAKREAQEELGISLDESKLKHLLTLHKHDEKSSYVKVFMLLCEFEGEPRIMEGDKCSALEWFDLDSLPLDEMIDENVQALQAMKAGESYLEYGWKK